jgi:putative membrane protein
MYTRYKQSLVAAFAAAVVFGCGSGDKQAESPPSPSPPSPMPSTATDAGSPPPQPQSMSGGGGPQDTTSETSSTTTVTQATMDAKPPAGTLADGDILGVENALDAGEIKLGELGRKKAQHAQVRSFAGTMVTQHREAQAKAQDLAKKNGLTAKDNDISNKLKSDVSSTANELERAKGRDFDASYMDAQVRMHRDALGVIDTQLIPNAKNAALKDHLTTVRVAVADHLSKAQDIQSHLGAVGTSSTPAAAKGKTNANADHKAGGAGKGKGKGAPHNDAKK